jgi:hypothetical protein
LIEHREIHAGSGREDAGGAQALIGGLGPIVDAPDAGTVAVTVGDLLVLRDWLAAHGVTHVARESTGVYWKPVFYAVETAL